MLKDDKLHIQRLENLKILSSVQPVPRYQQFPRLQKNGSLAVVDWSQSFLLNSKLKEFTIISEGTVLFRGVSKSHGLERSSPDESKQHILSMILTLTRLRHNNLHTMLVPHPVSSTPC